MALRAHKSYFKGEMKTTMKLNNYNLPEMFPNSK